MVRAVLTGVAIAAALLLGIVQFASEAILAQAGQPHSLPARLHPAAGEAIYRGIARIAQAPFVDGMLARAALESGQIAQAQQYAQKLPDSATRDDLLGQVAQARGDDRTAEQYFVRAGDIEAIDRAVAALERTNPAYAYALEYGLMQRLQRSGTHPDAVAEAYWELGRLAWMQSERALAMRNYDRAIALSPLSEKFLISAGFTSYAMRDYDASQRYFMRALGVNPASADAYAGAGMCAFRQGDRARAGYYAQRSRAIDPNSSPLHSLEALLHS